MGDGGVVVVADCLLYVLTERWRWEEEDDGVDGQEMEVGNGRVEL